MAYIKDLVSRIGLYLQALAKWLVLAAVTGTLCGFLGSAFYLGVAQATLLRTQQPWLLWCLPAAGIAVVAVYKLTRTEGQGTDNIIEAVRREGPFHSADPRHLYRHRADPPVRRQRRPGGRRPADGRRHRLPRGTAVPHGRPGPAHGHPVRHGRVFLRPVRHAAGRHHVRHCGHQRGGVLPRSLHPLPHRLR
jgi:hypothetical protein